jgi:small subunit ribosomal protein S9
LGKGDILVNEKPLNDVFTDAISRKVINEPFLVVSREGTFNGTIKLAGGGIKGQADAVAHGVARALVAYDEALRSPLAKAGLLTRDPRMKESRKYGLAGKARRGKQSPKR